MLPAPTLAQAVQLSVPFIVAIITLLGAPTLVFLMRTLNAQAAAIQNATWRAHAETAVHAVEQVLAKAPSVSKREEGMRILMSFGVPAAEASALLEAAVHALNMAAQDIQAHASMADPLLRPIAPPPSAMPHAAIGDTGGADGAH